MGDASINGDMPQSHTLGHIVSYPLVKNAKTTVESNPFGQRGIDFVNTLYGAFVKPTFPYLQTPYSYAAPYVAKADEIGDNVLSKFDEKIPVFKKEPAELQSTASDILFYPIKQAGATKDYAFNTYNQQYKECGGNGLVAGAKATITSSVVFVYDGADWFGSFFQAKKEQTKKVVAENTDN